MTLKNHVIEGSSNYKWELFTVHHYLVKFGRNRYFSRDVVLVCHVIKQDHIIKGSGDDDDIAIGTL